MIMAVRPDLVNRKTLDTMSGQVRGEWQAGVGYTDNPAEASAKEGRALLEIIVRGVSDLFVAFHRSVHSE